MTSSALGLGATAMVATVWIVSAFLPEVPHGLAYAAWSVLGAAAGGLVPAAACLARVITGDREWTVVTWSGLVIALFWVLSVAVATVLG